MNRFAPTKEDPTVLLPITKEAVSFTVSGLKDQIDNLKKLPATTWDDPQELEDLIQDNLEVIDMLEQVYKL